MPQPIVERGRRRRRRSRVSRGVLIVVAFGITAAVVGAVVVMVNRTGDEPVEPEAVLGPPAGLLEEQVGLLDSRGETVDGEFAAVGSIEPGEPFELRVRGRHVPAGDSGLVALRVVPYPDADGQVPPVTVVACDSTEPATGSTTTHHVVIQVGSADDVCVTSERSAEVRIELVGFVDPAEIRPIAVPVRLVDTRVDGVTSDRRFETIGVRPERSTLRVPVTNRFTGLDEIGAFVVGITAVDALDDGDVVAYAAEVPPPEAQVSYASGGTSGDVVIVPLGASGELCVDTSGRTDLVVDILAVVPSSVAPPVVGDGSCPGQTMFPDRRVVAMYGTQRSERLGVLGEQDPAASAARLEEIVAPWRAADSGRPVLPTFELIATLATGTPEDRGVYNLQASPEFVQEYLDVARRHGFYLVLDIQPGQSDFLTEVRYYEEFLRQPDVGLALDPEWHTEPPLRPRGGTVGQVDAAEVNAVIDYLAALVEQEHLPEKLLVVHQFQERMVTNRELIMEQPGVALTIHMDGFGDRGNKLASYDVVRAQPPWNMGLKLFYDEDIDIYRADEVLGGAFDPIPDVITYQ